MGIMLIRDEPTSASAVRRELALDLDLHGVDEESIEAATLVASELVGNAVRHAGIGDGGELDVGWTLGRHEVYIRVDDPSRQLPVRRYPTPEAPNGRGLAIIDALSSAWGTEPRPRGKRVWARVPVQPWG